MKINIFVVLFFFLVLQIALYSGVGIDNDEGAILFIGNSIRDGHVPYKDYTILNTPFALYLVSAAFFFLGKTLFAARLLIFIFNTMSVYLVYKISGMHFSKDASLLSATSYSLALLMPAFNGFMVLAEPFMVFFILLSVFFFLKHDKMPSEKSLFLAGMFLGTASMFKQTATLLLIGYFAYFALKICKERNEKSYNRLYGFLPINAGFLIMPLLTFIYFYYIGAFPDFIRWTTASLDFSIDFAWLTVVYQFVSLLPIWGLSFLAAVLAFRKNADRGKITLIYLLFLLPFFIPFIRAQYGQYVLPIIPFVSILAVSGTEELAKYMKGAQLRKKIAVALILLLFIVASLGINAYSGMKMQYSGRLFLDEQIEIAEYIEEITPENEFVYVYGYAPSLYFLSDRIPPVKYLHIWKPFVNETTQHEIANSLEKNDVQHVVKVSSCDIARVICNYIMNHYVKNLTIGGAEIYSRRH